MTCPLLRDPGLSGAIATRHETGDRRCRSSLRNRHFLKLLDFTADEILLPARPRREPQGRQARRLRGRSACANKEICLIFEKTSTRTRCSFEVAAYDQGAHVTYLDPQSSQMGHKESIKDTARVLGRLYDGIEYRGFDQAVVETLAEYAGVPVWNGLTDEFHPTQILADMLTMREHSIKPLPADRLRVPGRRGQQHGQLAA